MSFLPCVALRRFVAKGTPAISTYQRYVFRRNGSYQFIRVPGNTEWVEDYIWGGFHPVHLGDIFKKRYRIIRKLGNGRSATVWLAKDDRSVFLTSF